MTSSACVGGSYRGWKLPEGGVKTWDSQVVRYKLESREVLAGVYKPWRSGAREIPDGL